MLPVAKVTESKPTHPTRFLMLSSRVPNLSVSLLPSIQCEIPGQTCLITLESCMADTNLLVDLVSQSLSCGRGGLGLGSNGLSLTNEPSMVKMRTGSFFSCLADFALQAWLLGGALS